MINNFFQTGIAVIFWSKNNGLRAKKYICKSENCEKSRFKEGFVMYKKAPLISSCYLKVKQHLL